MKNIMYARKIKVVILALAMSVVLTACSSTSKTTSEPSKAVSSKITIGFALKPLDNPYFATMNKGAVAAASKLNVGLTVVTASSLSDASGQANRLAALIAHGYSCYIANPVNATNLVEPLTKAMAQHKPIVNVDLPISKSAAAAAGVKIDTYIGTDNVQAGELSAKTLAKFLPKGAEVAIVGGPASDPTSIPRVKGFTEAAQAAGLKVIQTVAANWEETLAENDASAIMSAHPHVAGFMVANGEMAEGVVKAIADAGKTGKVGVVAIVGDTTTIKDVENGTMTAVVEQFPYTIGYMGVQACVAAAKGKTLPADVATPVQAVTKANAAKALSVFPEPFEAYSDPFTALDK